MALSDAEPFAVAAYDMNEASGNALDSSGSGHDATETSGTIASAAGKLGNARDFEQGDTEYFAVSNHVDFRPATSKFMVRVWINAESFAGTNNWILAKEDVADGEYELQIDDIGTLSWKVYAASGYGSATSVSWGSLLSTSTWYLVHAWIDPDADVIGIAVNAGTAVTTAFSTGVYESSAPFEIGALSAYTRHFDGLIDEVVVLKGYILDATERSADYNSGNGVAFTDWGAGGGSPVGAAQYAFAQQM